ncbi:MAG: hypothetical protein GXY70_06090 [Euryarchaeota archaeon]|nr:hypothetical protein [Euryarchaeota archaeon]
MVLKGGAFAPSDFLRELIVQGFDPLLVSPCGQELPYDPGIVVLEPERGDREIRAGDRLHMMRALITHLVKGERKAVVMLDLQVFKEECTFHDITDLLGRLYEEACVHRGLLLLFADPAGFSDRELAFLEREMPVIERPEQL